MKKEKRTCYIDEDGNMRDTETNEIIATLGEVNECNEQYVLLNE